MYHVEYFVLDLKLQQRESNICTRTADHSRVLCGLQSRKSQSKHVTKNNKFIIEDSKTKK